MVNPQGETGATVEPLVDLGWYLTPASECMPAGYSHRAGQLIAAE
jgi:hypothetical protein